MRIAKSMKRKRGGCRRLSKGWRDKSRWGKKSGLGQRMERLRDPKADLSQKPKYSGRASVVTSKKYMSRKRERNRNGWEVTSVHIRRAVSIRSKRGFCRQTYHLSQMSSRSLTTSCFPIEIWMFWDSYIFRFLINFHLCFIIIDPAHDQMMVYDRKLFILWLLVCLLIISLVQWSMKCKLLSTQMVLV